jgi:hypothetical protein
MAASRPDDHELMRYAIRTTDHRERLVTWKMDRLKKSGKLSSERALELITSSFDDPAAARRMDSGLALLGEMGTLLGKVAAASDASDDDAACRGAIDMLLTVEKIAAAVEPQWAAMERIIDKEAERLGVSLE